VLANRSAVLPDEVHHVVDHRTVNSSRATEIRTSHEQQADKTKGRIWSVSCAIHASQAWGAGTVGTGGRRHRELGHDAHTCTVFSAQSALVSITMTVAVMLRSQYQKPSAWHKSTSRSRSGEASLAIASLPAPTCVRDADRDHPVAIALDAYAIHPNTRTKQCRSMCPQKSKAHMPARAAAPRM
jgi:hypothetical protein